MITEQHWFVVYTRRDSADVPIAAFADQEAARCYGADIRDSVIQRPLFIGDADTKAVRLLRDIVRPDFTVEDDRRMQKAIDEAKRMLGYQ